MIDPRPIFEAALIVHVAQAARMAGLSFRNGLTKTEIIDRLCLAPGKTHVIAVAALQRLQGGPMWANAAPAPAIAPLVPDPDPWSDPDAGKAPVSVPAAPMATVDLAPYALRTELAQMGRELHARADAAQEALEPLNTDVQILRVKVAEFQASRPVTLQFPELPAPVRLPNLAHEKFSELVGALRAGVNVMLVGPAGSGKTFASEEAARILNLDYYKTQPASYAFEIIGALDAHNRYHATQTRKAMEFGGLNYYDEFDSWTPEAGMATNQICDTSSIIAFPDGNIRRHEKAVTLTSANTDGSGASMQYAGRNRLDGATLNRFYLIDWDYSPRVEDKLGASCPAWVAAVRDIRAFAIRRGILDVVATQRDIVTGCRVLSASGDTPQNRQMILGATQKRGALRECWPEVERLAAVQQFLKG